MIVKRSAAESDLDDISRGVADDVFLAELSRRFLEQLDEAVQRINNTGIGKLFVANLQIILQHALVLSVTRIYEPYCPRNPGRTLPAAIRHIEVHATALPVPNRASLVDYLASHGHSRDAVDALRNEQLSLTFAKALAAEIPRPDTAATSPLSQALAQLKTVRDKAIAHHDRVSPSSLLIPGWVHLVTLIDTARAALTLVARAYLSVGYNLDGDAALPAHSLRELLHRAGLGAESEADPRGYDVG
jgi:hypothetical protein